MANFRHLLARAQTVLVLLLTSAGASAQVLGDPIDVSRDFWAMENVYFVGSKVPAFDPNTGRGVLTWDRYTRNTSLSFNKVDIGLARSRSTEFPGTEYDENPSLPFSITFVSPRTVRLRFTTRAQLQDRDSLMLVGPPSTDSSWKVDTRENEVVWTSAHGRVRLVKEPWRIEIYDNTGRLLTRTQNVNNPRTFYNPIPFSFVRHGSDLARSIAGTFELSHSEKIFGCGESFTRLNKRGQKINVFTRDGMGVQAELMYKPIPVFLQQRIRDVRSYERAGYLRLRQALRPAQRDLYEGRRARSLSVYRDPERDSGGVHRAHRQEPGAAALVVRVLDEPHHLQVGR
jgi:alpha-D-xyloside xylohydrolase